mmetsp:Transcript_81404/g.119243  ORF Transcript_81404/g.119243 Transcript_81404/m.119243 type:complete len:396 (+) Transcript_81404:53-1240(+)
MTILIREEERSRSAIVLRVALSSTLPLILVLFAASQQGGIAEPSALYVIYNTGEYPVQPVKYAQPVQFVQPVQYAQPNAYYNAVNTAELSTNVNPYDAAALQYSSGPPQKQMQTLHALASAKRLYHQMQVPSAASPRSQYNSAVATANNPESALQQLQGKQYVGSAASKQIAQASLSIQQVLEQSKADDKLANAATSSARTTKDKGNSWQSLMSRQSGPRAEAKASDWLSTAVATSSSKGSKTKYARAQLEAALSQVDGHYSHDADKSAWGNEKRERNSELRAMTKLADAVMFKVLSGTAGGPSSPSLAPLAATSWKPAGSSSSSWQSSSGTATYPPSSSASSSSSSYAVAGSMSGGATPAAPGGTSTSSEAAMSGAAPGLSSYDAQILAGGPPQ